MQGAVEQVFEFVEVIGRGRAGAAVAARLAERGLLAPADPRDSGHRSAPSRPGRVHDGRSLRARWRPARATLVLLCVPDSAIAQVAAAIEEGPWVAHVSGATPLAALSPHAKRFSVHPLQTFVRWRGAEQLDGAWAAVTGDTADALARATWLAETLGLRPFALDDSARAAYHAGASIASNYLVTLYRSAARLLRSAGAPPEALVPLMRRTIENDFELTGPIARGDWATVEAHLAAIARTAPELEDMYRALARLTAP
jgi:predicted short-subunit dehydrogenase-like oxidoreductase (DUF2520 family)